MNAVERSLFRNARGRTVLALSVGSIAGLAGSPWLSLRACLVLAWDSASLTLLLVSWLLLARASAEQTARRAAAEDPGRRTLRLITISSCLTSLFSVLAAMRKAESMWASHQAFVLLSLFAAVSSWLLMHTSYALHYAHLFYRDDGVDEPPLSFPGTKQPDGLDFAYYSFTIGMCYQTSDVSIQTRAVRTATLGHAVLSFVFNTAILALTVNLVVGEF